MNEVDLNFVEQVVARAGRKPEALIPILQALQEHFGYIKEQDLRRICELTDITPAAVE
jgi:NADH:ubiquinone oxidoreductase subunit E